MTTTTAGRREWIGLGVLMLPGESGLALLDAARVAFTSGLNIAAVAGGLTMAVGAILAVLLLRNVRTAPAVQTSEPDVQRVESAPASR